MQNNRVGHTSSVSQSKERQEAQTDIAHLDVLFNDRGRQLNGIHVLGFAHHVCQHL